MGEYYPPPGGGNSTTTASGLASATTTVVVSSATAPTANQVLTATSSTAADWANTQSSILPTDVGVVAWTGTPAWNVTTNIYASASYQGTLCLWMFKVPVAGTISNINYVVTTSGNTMSNAYLGVYSTAGTLLGSCATDQSTNMTSGLAARSAALSTPLAVNAGVYYVGLVVGTETTAPTLMACGTQDTPLATNLGLAAGNYLSCFYGSHNTYSALPGSFTPASTSSLLGMPLFVMN